MISLPSSAAEPWESVRRAFDQKDYPTALSLLQENPASADSASDYYNLGTTWFHLERFGLATAYLEKAATLAPSDPDVATNLRLARLQLAKILGKDRLDPAASLRDQIRAWIPLEQGMGIAGLLLLLFAGIGVRHYQSTRQIKSVFNSWIAIPAFVLTLGSGGLLLAEVLSEGANSGMLIERATIRSGPGDQFLDLGLLEVGQKIRLSGEQKKDSSPQAKTQDRIWVQILFRPGRFGWIPQHHLLAL